MQKELQVVQERIKKAEAAGDEAAAKRAYRNSGNPRAAHGMAGENARRFKRKWKLWNI